MIALLAATGASAGSRKAPANPNAGPSSPEPSTLLSRRPLLNGPLSIERATEIALRESPVVRGAVEEVEASLERLQGARAQARPQLSTTSFATGGSEASIYTTTDPVRPTNFFLVPRGAFFDQNATLMLPLYTGGRLRALVRQAAAARGTAGAELEGVRQEIALMTRTAYREALARQSMIEVARAVLSEAQERLRVDRTRLEAGAIPPFYLQRDESEVANAQQQLTNAQRDLDLSLVQLKTAMGVHPDSRLEPSGPLAFEPAAAVIERLTGPNPPTPFPAREGGEAEAKKPGPGSQVTPSLAGEGGEAGSKKPKPGSQVTPPLAGEGTGERSAATVPEPPSLIERYRAPLHSLAGRQRPELQAARLRTEQAAEGVAVARSADRPQIGIAVMGDAMTGAHVGPFGGASFGLTASLPLFDAGLRRANRRAAEADRRHREQDYERVVLDVAQQVTNVLLNLAAAEQNVATAQAAVRAAQEEYRVALERYQAGRGILVEALDALTARTRAETNVIQALYEYNVAQDQLRRAVGEPAGG